jgi:signal transduction histidine kinase
LGKISEISVAENSLKWRFDVNTFRLIGRELITDRITAVFELVKNCYDANATNVFVEFKNVSKDNHKGIITIRDDGEGMSLTDIREKWMVVGTASKRTHDTSSPPFNRRYVGEKGIGRFAVDKLGGKVYIKTKKRSEKKLLTVEINWDNYENLAKQKKLTLFTDIENRYYETDDEENNQGTTLEIHNLHDSWSSLDLERLYKELGKIVSPFYPLNPPFNVIISSNEIKKFDNRLVFTDTVKYSSNSGEIGFDLEKGKQEILEFNEKIGKIVKKQVSLKSFGPVKMKLFYFDENAKRNYNAAYRKDRIDGVKIYRDGLITTPFAEFESNPNKQRDIIGIDKRMWANIWDNIGSREIIGVVEITKNNNPCIIDATNRQDFVDNIEYRELKDFILDQIDVFSKLKKYEREKRKGEINTGLIQAKDEVQVFTETIEKIVKKSPGLKPLLAPLKKQAKNINSTLKKGLDEQKRVHEDFVRKENIYLSLMSLQDYATRLSHAVRTSLGKIKRMAEFFKDYYPNLKHERYFKEYAVNIFNEMSTLDRVIDFMLSYAASNIDFEEFNLNQYIEEIFALNRINFNAENIKTIVEINKNFTLVGNKIFIQDIIQNLISNSIKALTNTKEKIIKCTGNVEDDNFILIFSDNGCGIKPGDEDKVFDIYYTTTSEQGGAGLGLFIVKMRLEAMKGAIEVTESEFKPGATFKITFPFNKNPK